QPARVRQHAVKQHLDPSGALVKLLACPCAHQEIQAHAEHPLVTALERVPQALSVLNGYFPLRIDEPTLARIEQPRCLKLDQLMAKSADLHGGRKRPDVQAQLYGQVTVDQRLKPAGRNCAWVCGDSQYPRVLAVEAQMVDSHFAASGRD